MFLDQRGYTVLDLIVNHPNITGKELERKLGLSRKQLSYSLGKVNDFLGENGFEKIERSKTGKLSVPLNVVEQFGQLASDTREVDYVYSEEERMYIISLMLVNHQEELSSYHFTEVLKVSKNTLLSDLKSVQLLMKEYDLQLLYDRKAGYVLIGPEYAKRKLLTSVVRKILQSPFGQTMLRQVGEITEEELADASRGIEEVENILHLQLTDERMREFPYILLLILKRIQQEKYLTEMPEAFQHILGTREYSAIAPLAEKYQVTQQNERLYLAVLFQVSNIQSLANIDGELEEELRQVATQVVQNFEVIACIAFKEKEQLIDALVQHCKPAYYRIRYHFHLENSITAMVLPQYQDLHDIVRKSIEPFEVFLQEDIGDEELVYITILFGGWLRREGIDQLQSQVPKAVVVCTNGISISHYLSITLKELFPEFEFSECLSERSFQTYDKNYDIVFSTVRVETQKPLFIIDPLLNTSAKNALKAKVNQVMNGASMAAINVDTVMKIIEKYSDVRNKDQLKQSLDDYLYQGTGGSETPRHPIPEEHHGKVGLEELLTEKTVLLKTLSKNEDWQEVLTEAAQPLLAANVIQPRYLTRMIELITKEQPYLMIADGVVIAHAGPADGVNKIGMSLLRLDRKISVGGYLDADVIIVLAATDNTNHLKALYQLNTILEDEKKLKQLKKAKQQDKIMNIIKGVEG